MINLIPKGFKMTHEDIGMGKPVLVFVYDPNLAVSISQPEQMNIARDIVGDKALFLIAKMGTLEGDKLIADYGASRAELLLFDQSGQLIKRQLALIESEELVRWLDLAVL
jgi:hypothetical protein